MDFTVLIPSRNRTALLDRAIQSVLRQEHASFEILVINDGSDGEHEEGYRALARKYEGKAKFVHLDRLTAPHGKSSAINTGLANASGEFIGFLDDDDYWTTTNHLQVARQAIDENGPRVDIIFSNQRAGRDNFETEDLWIAALGEFIKQRAQAPDTCGMYWITTATLLQQPGFCHMNTTLIRRSLFQRMHGFDVSLPYEEDRDFYLRAIDEANGILYRPEITAFHSIPDPALAANMSTRPDPVAKLLSQLMFYNKNLVTARRAEIRRQMRISKRYALKELSLIHQKSGDMVTAYHFAREALLIGFTIKWFAYTMWLALKAGGASDPDRINVVRHSNGRTQSTVTSG